MSQTYLLPCPDCDYENPVTARNAGTSVSCSKCRSVIVVPKLGELRQFAVDEETEPTPARGTSWDIRKGRIFALGMIILVVLSVAAVGLMLFAETNYETDSGFEKIKEESFESFDKMTDEQAYMAFSRSFEPVKLDQWQESIFLQNARTKSQFYMVGYVLLAIGIIGGVATMFLGTKMKAKPR